MKRREFLSLVAAGTVGLALPTPAAPIAPMSAGGDPLFGDNFEPLPAEPEFVMYGLAAFYDDGTYRSSYFGIPR